MEERSSEMLPIENNNKPVPLLDLSPTRLVGKLGFGMPTLSAAGTRYRNQEQHDNTRGIKVLLPEIMVVPYWNKAKARAS